MEFSLNGTENFVTEFAEHLGKTREITLHSLPGIVPQTLPSRNVDRCKELYFRL